ncbi:MAG: hypothetical protein KKE86_16315 [Planctomycetes bacterium]|nr:hypothetical protein [Planctomycetota bacterium]MBU4400880.1 hypothetical protein [Planctomycetota bacterium]MCG2682407.1 hypothetical protein [Planctomycetales bacterium]
MDDDKTQRHIKYTIIAFCGTVMICMFLFAWLRGGMGYVHFLDYFGAVLLAALAGGATFGVAHVLEL